MALCFTAAQVFHVYSTFTLAAKTAQISHLSYSTQEWRENVPCRLSSFFPFLSIPHYMPYDPVVLSSCLTDTIIIIIFLLKLTHSLSFLPAFLSLAAGEREVAGILCISHPVSVTLYLSSTLFICVLLLLLQCISFALPFHS